MKSFIQFITEGFSGLDYWYNIKKKKKVDIKPYRWHVGKVVNSPKTFGLTKSKLLELIEKELAITQIPGTAEDILDDLKDGTRDTQTAITTEVKTKGWVRVSLNSILGTNSMGIEALTLKEAQGVLNFQLKKSNFILDEVRIDIVHRRTFRHEGFTLGSMSEIEFFAKHGKMNTSKLAAFR